MFDTNTLFTSLIFGSIGMGYFMYGKSSHSISFLLSGIILMIFPYFISNFYYSIVIGIIFIIIPFFIKIDY